MSPTGGRTGWPVRLLAAVLLLVAVLWGTPRTGQRVPPRGQEGVSAPTGVRGVPGR